jgi:hypothetical protein
MIATNSELLHNLAKLKKSSISSILKNGFKFKEFPSQILRCSAPKMTSPTHCYLLETLEIGVNDVLFSLLLLP